MCWYMFSTTSIDLINTNSPQRRWLKLDVDILGRKGPKIELIYFLSSMAFEWLVYTHIHYLKL